MRIALAIPSLERGGAETQFVLLANALAQRGHAVDVVVLGSGGALEPRLRGVRVIHLGKRGKADLPRTVASLARLLRRERPDVAHGYLPTANVLLALATLFCPGPPLAFGIRASDMERAGLGAASRLMYALERLLSRRAGLIIANSEAGRRHAQGKGMDPRKLVVVQNAVDPGLAPEPEAGAALRRQWGVEPAQRLIGVVARLDPVKGHLDFAAAALELARRRDEARFVLVGGGAGEHADLVRARFAAPGLAERTILAGERGDMAAVYSALDMLCLPSRSEGFPNVLGEAMACGVPCATTDAGDAALVVGDCGVVVPRGDAAALASGMDALLARLEAEGEAFRRACRERIAEHFSVERLAAATEALLLRLAGGRA